MFSCIYCRASFPSQYLLTEHIQRDHRGGYPESPQEVVDNRSGKVELKALEHSLSAMKEKLEKQRPLSNPIPAPITRPPPEQLVPSKGWRKLSDNSYVFEEEIAQYHTPFDSTTIVLDATLNQKHGKCLKHEYTRDLRELNRLQEKRIVLDSRLSQLVPSDYKYGSVAMELSNVTQMIDKLTKDVRPDDERHEIVFEDYYTYDLGSNENIQWMKKYMDKVVSESEKLSEKYKRYHESDSK